MGKVRYHQRDRVRSILHPAFAVSHSRFPSLYNKESEFRAWLVEERMINPETITKDQTRKEFARFVEDYNTGTSTSSTTVAIQ